MVRTEPCTAYLAPRGFVDQLAAELGEVLATHDRLLIAAGPARPVSFVENIWHEPRHFAIDSIGHGARTLREIQRNWALYPFTQHRRAALLAEKLPHVSGKPLVFPNPAPAAPLGSWTLLDRDTLLAAPRCSSPFPNGEVQFVEDRASPPNRAYLKLFEALTVLGRVPGPGDRCLDLGSSPGGWTWVLQQTGARVLSVDKAPLDPRIASLPNVTFRQESAFAIDPGSTGKLDWLCCDVACYPDRLLGLVHRWLDVCPRMVCTVKLQGATDHAAVDRFRAIPGARLVHLHHNKHELTFLRAP
jgi:23S rRNA (cytidine2498-2'-O)-methyltransferase